MKKLLLPFFAIAFCLPLFSQEEEVVKPKNDEIQTLLGNRSNTNGGYGALTFGYTQIDNLDAVIMGGRGAWVIGHGIALGLSGAGFMNDYSYNPFLDRDVNLTGGYGGLFIEPIVFPRFPVHLAFPVTLGAGGIAYASSYRGMDYNDWDYYVEDTYAFFVAEAGVELEFNVVRFFRLSLYGTYRVTSSIDLYDTPSDVLNGWSAGITLKFGRF